MSKLTPMNSVLTVPRNTTASGDVAELEIAAALARDGRKLLRPMSSASRYDLVVDNDDGTFTRIQCKTARTIDGRLEFRLYSISGHTPLKKGYSGQVDAFGVYCRESRRTFLVPVGAIDRCATTACLRVEPPRNGQRRGIRVAVDFEIGTGRRPSGVSSAGTVYDLTREAMEEASEADAAELRPA